MKENKENENALFYTNDVDYKRFNNMRFTVLGNLEDTSVKKGCERYAVKLEDGTVIRAFGDELDGFIRNHEDDPIEIPVAWQMQGMVKIPADTIQNALFEFNRMYNEIRLPDGEYIDSSFELAAADEEIIATYNHPFRSPSRNRNAPSVLEDKYSELYWIAAKCGAETKEGVCPVCGGTELDYEGSGELRNKKCGYKWTCSDCGAEGFECYNLMFSEQVLEEDEIAF